MDRYPPTSRSILSHVGNTPLVALQKKQGRGLILAKTEYLNPTGSVKDRAAARMIQVAIEKENLMSSGKRILDSSSGNTGISLSAFGASLSIKVTIVLPESASLERQKLLRLYGAEIISSDPMEGSDGAMEIARDLVSKEPDKYCYTDQYSNDANWQAHYYGTAEEIWEQTEGKITHFVSGVGTGGTVMGTGRRLKELNQKIQIIAVEPDQPLHGIEGLKHIESSIKPKIFDPNFPDKTIFVKTEDAQREVLRLSKEEGIFAGTSSGATSVAAKSLATTENEFIVAIFADQGARYFSEKYLQ
jgi:S-sulfo-L-cysteine synthase (O-acetyl-L-serine-dependent)